LHLPPTHHTFVMETKNGPMWTTSGYNEVLLQAVLLPRLKFHLRDTNKFGLVLRN
jgi:hypothetical protein